MTAPIDVSVAKLRKQIRASAEKIKASILAHIERETDPVNQNAEVSMALLDLALDRYVELHGEPDARRLVDSAFKRAVARWKSGMN
ncbi:hypothetical protein [Acidicapsa acidisoli]|uniref:hypothetical protein n=1 Tax=Acidicapsa acidisoli TaxID=1615681 RepID=UPI0021DF8593|nr:hypothetical protein [Acidicapsa acidisoli]